MKLRELLDLIRRVAKIHHIPEPFLVGGSVRDRVMKQLKNLNDIDIMNADSSISNLSEEVYKALSQSYSVEKKVMSDGHSSIFLGNTKIDFSSNFILPGIEEILKKQGIHPTAIKKEVFSRDFTVNALLMDTSFKRVLDPTKKGIQDIKNKILRTCLDPAITLSSNLNRIPRILYLAAKLKFSVDPPIIEFVKKHHNLVKQVDSKYFSKLLNKAISYDKSKTIELLDQMDLWGVIDIPETLYQEYANRFVKKSQLRKNYDYGGGEGLYYGNMDRFKSIMDWRKKRKKKQKKEIKKIKEMKLK